MNVHYVATTRAKLDETPISNGQLIAIIDESAYYYDMNNRRHLVSGVRVVDSLPAEGEPGCCYIDTHLAPYRMYIWDIVLSQFVDIGGQYNVETGLVLDNNTLKANLVEQPKLEGVAVPTAEVSDRIYPVTIDHEGHLAVVVPWQEPVISWQWFE